LERTFSRQRDSFREVSSLSLRQARRQLCCRIFTVGFLSPLLEECEEQTFSSGRDYGQTLSSSPTIVVGGSFSVP